MASATRSATACAACCSPRSRARPSPPCASRRDHEFDSLEGVYEDVTDIILNLKRLRIRYEGTEPITCRISKSGKGPVTGADVECEGDAEVVNKDLVIAP